MASNTLLKCYQVYLLDFGMTKYFLYLDIQSCELSEGLRLADLQKHNPQSWWRPSDQKEISGVLMNTDRGRSD